MKGQRITKDLRLFETHLETGSSAADPFRDADRRFVQVGYIPHDGQAKAGAYGPRSGDTEEAIKNTLVILWIDQDPAIGLIAVLSVATAFR